MTANTHTWRNEWLAALLLLLTVCGCASEKKHKPVRILSSTETAYLNGWNWLADSLEMARRNDAYQRGVQAARDSLTAQP